MGWTGPMTHRQYEVWQMWRTEQWNTPNRSDHYAMLIAYMIARSNAKNPGSVRYEKMKLKFGSKQPTGPKKITQQSLQMMKAASLARLGRDVRIRLPDGTLVTKRQILEMTPTDEQLAAMGLGGVVSPVPSSQERGNGNQGSDKENDNGDQGRGNRSAQLGSPEEENTWL